MPAVLYDHALCSLEDVKETLGIDAGNTQQDNLIVRKINQATDMIENYTGRRFKLTTYTDEEYDSPGGDQLILKQRPVTALTSFGSRDSSFNDNDWDTFETDRYFLDSNAGVVDLTFNTWGRWNRFKVTYTAGYSTIPADISEAAATLAAYLVENPTSTVGIRRKKEGQREIEYFDSSTNSNSLLEQLNLDDILDSYSNYPILADK